MMVTFLAAAAGKFHANFSMAACSKRSKGLSLSRAMPINAPRAPLANTGTLRAVAWCLLMCSGTHFPARRSLEFFRTGPGAVENKPGSKPCHYRSLLEGSKLIHKVTILIIYYNPKLGYFMTLLTKSHDPPSRL